MKKAKADLNLCQKLQCTTSPCSDLDVRSILRCVIAVLVHWGETVAVVKLEEQVINSSNNKFVTCWSYVDSTRIRRVGQGCCSG